MKIKYAALLLIVACAVAFSATPAFASPLSGAVWTTTAPVDGVCSAVDANLYLSKQIVYLNGGPHGKASGALPAGNYYVQVTTPSGAPLGHTPGADVTVTSDGVFADCYNLWNITVKQSDGSTGYDNTDQTGEYKVWIDNIDNSFKNNDSKTDNFRAPNDVPPCDPSVSDCGACPDCGNNQGGGDTSFVGYKFYDSNGNGVWDDGEPALAGWPISFDGGTQTAVTDANGRYEFIIVSDGIDHTINEGVPLGGFNSPGGSSLISPWVNTNGAVRTATSLPVGVDGEVDPANFGNMCVGGGNGHTIGFWSNKNGLTVLNSKSANLGNLVALNLVNANGSNFDPATYAKYQSWLLSATATNMAYMLSAQMSSMYLSTTNTNATYSVGVNGNAYIYSPASPSANAGGFVTVNTLINDANTSAGANPLTVSASAARNYQTALKNALDAGNNNANVFIQPSTCALPTTFQ